MSFRFDFDRMEELLKSFFAISGVRYSLMDSDGNIICHSGSQSPFCARMNQNAEGHSRCEQCDADGVLRCGKGGGYLTYRCHAGLLETILPICQDGETLGYIVFGQTLGAGDRAAQWRATREKISWMPNADEMEPLFFEQRQMDASVIGGCANILSACSSYISMQAVIRTASMTDEQLLARFIEENYGRPLLLGDIAEALSMSKTKLCGVAAKQGTTVKTMLNNRRMEEAKRMLRHGEDRIGEIADLVGLPDFNYFTKQFKAYTGETPRAYRERHRLSRGNP